MLNVHRMQLVLNEFDLGIVVNGMIDIFPSLRHCSMMVGSFGFGWEEFSERLREIQGNEDTPGMPQVGVTFPFPFARYIAPNHG